MENKHRTRSLAELTTMRLGGEACDCCPCGSEEEIADACNAAAAAGKPVYVLGGGSNTIAHDGTYPGVVILNRIKGYRVVEQTPARLRIEVGAGEKWDDVVQRTVDAGFPNLAALSNIPGTAGAAPVQNIGAYGQEVADSIESVRAYDLQTRRMATLVRDECEFSYRHSIFRGRCAGRYIITSVMFDLHYYVLELPFYKAVEDYFSANATTEYTPQTLRDAVIRIRADKLPDPAVRPNSGSFFKNAVVEDALHREILQSYPGMPSFPLSNGMHKIPTGWLIEKTGLKGALLHGMRVHDKNALVLINESASRFADLAAARAEIIDAVHRKFKITIEQEPLEISAP